jgi:uncharacterized SAM-dependent methyltransferase
MRIADVLSFESRVTESAYDFERDIIDWFSGLRSGHLGKWRYEYVPEGSPAAGGPIWEELAARAKNYYVSREGDRALVQSLDFIARTVINPDFIFDLGPGTLRPAIKALLSRIGANSTYVPVDVAAEFLKAAQPLKDEKIVRHVMPRRADFTQEQFTQGIKGNKLFLFLGSTFGNLPTAANSDPEHEALRLLSHLRDNMSEGDRMLLVNDGNMDERTIIDCYTGPLNQDYYMVIPHKIANDLKPSGNFDPLAWKPEVQWWPLTSQCSHGMVATKDQNFSIGSRHFYIPEGTTLNASNSFNFSAYALQRLMNKAGFKTQTYMPPGNKLVLAVGVS